MTESTTATAQIEAFLAALPPGQHGALQGLRETIAAAAPEATETISYGMPAFRYHGKVLVYYAAFKAHCSFFPASGASIARHAAELEGFVTSKGTLQFTPGHPIPADLVRRMVRDRMAEIDAR